MGLRDYSGRDNYGKPKQDFLAKLVALSDAAFVEEAEHRIWLSAYAGNNPRSDFHWQSDACYDEAERRQKPELYVQAYGLARGSV